MRVGNAQQAESLLIYEYQFLDDLSFVRAPKEVFTESSESELAAYMVAVRHRLSEAGWEGDGELEIIWFPPFVDIGIEDTWGTYVWHVKQSNNGISWLASEVPLTFTRLRKQNENLPFDTHVRAGVMYIPSVNFVRTVRRILADAQRQLRALDLVGDPVLSEVRDKLLVTTQGELISQLNSFLDDCYLEVLIEVLDNGNPSGLRLRRFKATLNPTDYIPDDGQTYDADAGQWFTRRRIISDIWHSYRFEPFAAKTEMLFKACDFVVDQKIQREIVKHVQLRNCVQHHEGHVTNEAVERAGVKEFPIVEDDGSVTKLGPPSPIRFSLAELTKFGKNLLQLAVSFDRATQKRFRNFTWVPRSFVLGKKPEKRIVGSEEPIADEA